MKLAALSFSLSLLCLVEGFAGGSSRPAALQPAGPTEGSTALQKPPPDYAETQGGHYKVHVERATWREAQAACEAEGAHLVVLDSKKEAGAVRELIARQPANVTNELHAGFLHPDYFVSTFGTPLSKFGYQEWAPEQEHNETCGTINHAMLMFVSKCSDKRSFICEHNKNLLNHKLLFDEEESPNYFPLPLYSKQPPSSRGNYTPSLVESYTHLYSGLVNRGRLHYYRLSRDKYTWPAAKRTCENEHAYLLEINHQDEAIALKEYFKISLNYKMLFVGFHDVSNKIVTVFGSHLEYSNWEAGQPEYDTCLAVDTNLLLKKVSCWEEMEFICEKTYT